MRMTKELILSKTPHCFVYFLKDYPIVQDNRFWMGALQQGVYNMLHYSILCRLPQGPNFEVMFHDNVISIFSRLRHTPAIAQVLLESSDSSSWDSEEFGD